MARKRKAAVPAIEGARVGTKKSDKRWLADGVVWASRFEYLVYSTLKEKGYNVRKTDQQDTMAYSRRVNRARCGKCGSDCVVEARSYTPDLYVVPRGRDATAGYYLEVKGYIRSPERTLLRAFRKARPSCDLRMVVQRDYKVGKSTLVGWATRLLKVPAVMWTGDLPEEWK